MNRDKDGKKGSQRKYPCLALRLSGSALSGTRKWNKGLGIRGKCLAGAEQIWGQVPEMFKPSSPVSPVLKSITTGVRREVLEMNFLLLLLSLLSTGTCLPFVLMDILVLIGKKLR